MSNRPVRTSEDLAAGASRTARVRWRKPNVTAVRGAVYVEFLVAFVPVLIFFLGLLQLGLHFCAKLVVQHAATRAVRAAVVVMEDKRERYNDEEQGLIVYDGSSGQESQNELAGIASELNVPGNTGSFMSGGSTGNARLNAIRRAAYMPLAAIAPSLAQLSRTFGLGDGSTMAEFGNGGRFLAGMLLYNRAGAMVTLRDAAGNVVEDIGSNDEITVHITYLYYCSIPFVSNFMCDSAADLSGFNQARDAVTAVTDAVQNGDIVGAVNAGQELRGELEAARAQFDRLRAELSYAENPELLVPFIFTNSHFRMLEAEATLPNQGACYYEGSSCYAGPASEED